MSDLYGGAVPGSTATNTTAGSNTVSEQQHTWIVPTDARIAQLEREVAEAKQRAEAREVDWIKACGELSAATRRAKEAEKLLDDIANRRIGREDGVPERIILSRVERAAHEYFDNPIASAALAATVRKEGT